MRVFVIFVLILLAGAGALGNWQHNRYLDLRRGPVQDRQEIFHDENVFHAAIWLQTPNDANLIPTLREFKQATESVEGVQWIYAGKTAVNGQVSQQMGPTDWSAVVLWQYPNREAFDRHTTSPEFTEALAPFEHYYAHGFKRLATQNALLPQILLARRVMRLLTFQPNVWPLKQVTGENVPENASQMIPKLLAERELGSRAIVVANLMKRGTPEQQAADAAYVSSMFDLMAERGYGPMHIGEAMSSEGTYDFDQVAFVYYPGVDYFADMVRSEYFQAIIGGKQLGDTQATVTVPILNLL